MFWKCNNREKNQNQLNVESRPGCTWCRCADEAHWAFQHQGQRLKPAHTNREEVNPRQGRLAASWKTEFGAFSLILTFFFLWKKKMSKKFDQAEAEAGCKCPWSLLISQNHRHRLMGIDHVIERRRNKSVGWLIELCCSWTGRVALHGATSLNHHLPSSDVRDGRADNLTWPYVTTRINMGKTGW